MTPNKFAAYLDGYLAALDRALTDDERAGLVEKARGVAPMLTVGAPGRPFRLDFDEYTARPLTTT